MASRVTSLVGHVAGLAGRVTHCIATHSHVAASLSSPPSHDTNFVSQHRHLPRVSQSLASYRSPWLHCIATQGRPLSAMIQFLYRNPTPSRSLPAVSWPYHAVSWLCLGRTVGRLDRVVAESWPVHASPCAASLPSLSQYILLYCDLNLKNIGQ